MGTYTDSDTFAGNSAESYYYRDGDIIADNGAKTPRI